LKTISVFIFRVVELVWVWWATQSCIYTCLYSQLYGEDRKKQACSAHHQPESRSSPEAGPRQVYIQDWVAQQTHTNSTTLKMKTEMVFETSVSTKAEPHYLADNLKELLH
jgi:hypothetical protein